MKLVLFLLSVLILTGCGKGGVGSTKFPSHVKLLIAGQSNGNANLQDSRTQISLGQHEQPYYPPNMNAEITVNSTVFRWFTPTAQNPSSVGITWLNLAALEPNHTFTITVVSHAGRSTQQQIDNRLYEDMLKALAMDHYDAVLWIQGESDAGQGLTETQTYNNMKQIIEMSRNVQYNLPWYVALNSYSGLRLDNPTRSAQMRIIREGIAFQGPDTDTLRTNPDYMDINLGEFSGAGFAAHAALWHESLRSKF